MPTGDGLLARVKPFGGRLDAAAVQALAEAAGAYGNGALELTRRGNIQVRGLHHPAAFAREMIRARLADADPAREARRNVVAVPPCDDALIDVAEELLAETAGLPAKFCVRVQGSHVWVGEMAAADRAGLQALLPLPSVTGEGRGEGAWRDYSDCLPCSTPQGDGHLLYLPFGQTTVAELVRLAAQTPELRTTPWRAFLSPVAVTGFPAQPSSISACAGAPACASATTPTRADATRLQAMGFASLHVSGCAKGCAHPSAATTLVGRDGRYDLVRHGCAGDAPALTGLTLEQAAAAL